MRDILVTLMVFGSLPFILKRPWIGVLVWSWLSYMNPHRLTWGFAYDMPFAQSVALTLLAGFFLTKGKQKIPKDALLVFWVIFIFWMLVSTVFALVPQNAFDYLIRVLKIQLLTILMLFLINEYKKLDYLIWVIVLSIGFFSVKGGFFTFITGGIFRVWGPPSSFIEENNSLAVATLMIIPLMYYLYKITTNRWIKYALLFGLVASSISAVGSQSRGALIAIVAVGGFLWLKSKTKLVSGVVIAILAISGWNFMPQSWHSRMESIQHYEQDRSAMGRINAWKYSVNVANDRFTGAGFESWTPTTFKVYAPNPDDVHAAHSIYFSTLADHGWPGLILFLIVISLAWRKLQKIIKSTQKIEELGHVNLLARMLQVSLIAYLSGGAFLSLSYFDLPWNIIAITVILGTLLAEKVEDPHLIHREKRLGYLRGKG